MKCKRCGNKIYESEIDESMRCIWCGDDYCPECSKGETKVEQCWDCEMLHKPGSKCQTDHKQCPCVCKGREKWHEHNRPPPSIAAAGLTGLNWYGLAGHCICKCYDENCWSGGSTDYDKIFEYPKKHDLALSDCQAAIRRANGHKNCLCECKGNHKLHYSECLCKCTCSGCGKHCNCSEKIRTMIGCSECQGTYVPPKELRKFMLGKAQMTEEKLLDVAMKKAGFQSRADAAAAYRKKNKQTFESIPAGFEVPERPAKKQRLTEARSAEKALACLTPSSSQKV